MLLEAEISQFKSITTLGTSAECCLTLVFLNKTKNVVKGPNLVFLKKSIIQKVCRHISPVHWEIEQLPKNVLSLIFYPEFYIELKTDEIIWTLIWNLSDFKITTKLQQICACLHHLANILVILATLDVWLIEQIIMSNDKLNWGQCICLFLGINFRPKFTIILYKVKEIFNIKCFDFCYKKYSYKDYFFSSPPL